MSDTVTIYIDGVEIESQPDQSLLQAADAAGVYIPRLCFLAGVTPHGSCRVCTVMVNGRPAAACTTPVVQGMIVENDSERLRALRRDLIDMLFVEGNHFCMFCEASGRCELQALAYRLGITAPRHPYQYPQRGVDATHPDVFLDHNRCILCARCIRTSREIDGTNALGFVGRGHHKALQPNAREGLGGTRMTKVDRAVTACPVGALVPKHRGYDVPVGRRPYDHRPIGSDVESRRGRKEE